MSQVKTWLHFRGDTEAAFNFYKKVFGTEFVDGIHRMSEVPSSEEHPISEKEKNLVMNVELPIVGGHHLVGNDAPESLGELKKGNNVDICLALDTREEVDTLFKALSEGGKVEMEPGEMGDTVFGLLVDKFGINWMLTCSTKA